MGVIETVLPYMFPWDPITNSWNGKLFCLDRKSYVVVVKKSNRATGDGGQVFPAKGWVTIYAGTGEDTGLHYVGDPGKIEGILEDLRALQGHMHDIHTLKERVNRHGYIERKNARWDYTFHSGAVAFDFKKGCWI